MLAIKGGAKTKTKAFPPWPYFDQGEEKALQEVLHSRQWWRTPGSRTLEFERAFAAYHQAKFGIAVTNGTHALEVALSALEVGFGDEVILPDFTFVATASAVLSTGALPVLVDVQDGTYCIDPDQVEAAITDRTRAIIAVHMAGHPADLDRLAEMASRHHLLLIEDSAHAHGTEWKKRKIGTFGIAGTFSFQASKLMTAGEGGIILTNDEAYEEKVRSVHDCGRLPGKWFYDHYNYGSNYRLSEWQGAVLTVQLRRLEAQGAKRFAHSRLLDELLGAVQGITPQRLDERCTHNGHYAYIFHYDQEAFAGLSRERFIEALKAEGIPEQASYPPLHALDLFESGAYKGRLLPGDNSSERRMQEVLDRSFPVTEKAAYETVWIPHFAFLGDEQDVQEIATAIQKIQRHASELLP
ncbi:MAG: DegT/DnrJ/EryC1/StrS family aminotransferase [Spirochaetaceae bacterium]|nr:MAG: DegT/DnrJ/EryC1/StrS family aminotransferase [Spirochaetaceae bacterium]